VLYRLSFRANPRMILLPVVLVGLIALGIVAWRFAGPVIGIAVLAIGAYVDVQIVRFVSKHLRSWVRTSDEGLSCRLPNGSTLHFDWESLTRAGLCLRPGSRSILFLYDEGQDRLLSIPDEYSRFDELEREIRGKVPARTSFQVVRLSRDETIEDWLKTQIH
jgi:hypothetical protein